MTAEKQEYERHEDGRRKISKRKWDEEERAAYERSTVLDAVKERFPKASSRMSDAELRATALDVGFRRASERYNIFVDAISYLSGWAPHEIEPQLDLIFGEQTPWLPSGTVQQDDEQDVAGPRSRKLVRLPDGVDPAKPWTNMRDEDSEESLADAMGDAFVECEQRWEPAARDQFIMDCFDNWPGFGMADTVRAVMHCTGAVEGTIKRRMQELGVKWAEQQRRMVEREQDEVRDDSLEGIVLLEPPKLCPQCHFALARTRDALLITFGERASGDKFLPQTWCRACKGDNRGIKGSTHANDLRPGVLSRAAANFWSKLGLVEAPPRPTPPKPVPTEEQLARRQERERRSQAHKDKLAAAALRRQEKKAAVEANKLARKQARADEEAAKQLRKREAELARKQAKEQKEAEKAAKAAAREQARVQARADKEAAHKAEVAARAEERKAKQAAAREEKKAAHKAEVAERAAKRKAEQAAAKAAREAAKQTVAPKEKKIRKEKPAPGEAEAKGERARQAAKAPRTSKKTQGK